ncbi:siphovirus ReqiPepy6 Gp37-like family protein [Clostridium botulinum]|uniref:siphovirus ReqiPepy6 Gp37-like family protein n=1 Tax=Clostridium botulinum TaxID=1491 RepID=UPI000957B39F|nr:siphovirus ReqiPepy6 Gp37-like family protein [Clostridium botulinum]APU61187.1 siphovirus ReqiPepy6 Gp37-like family protein [Clostridium botulinum]
MNKVPIRIIDKDFNLLGEVDDYESLVFIRRFSRVGEFELHINLEKNNVDKLQEDNLILLGAYFNKVGIIEFIDKSTSEDGKEQLVIKGATLKGKIKDRTTVPPIGQGYDNATGTQETIIKKFVDNNAVNPVDRDRIIPNLIIAEDKQRGKQDAWRARYENLADKITEIAEYSNLGWDITLDTDNNKFVFDVIEGRNLTADQEQLPPVIFSVDFDNIKNKHFVKSLLNYKNVAYVGGKGEDEKRLIQQAGNAKGWARKETFIDCSQADDITELKTMGEHKLDDFNITETFESSVISFGSFNYMQDWDLGDIVTVIDRKWGITLNTRVTEVKEIYEVGGFNLECIFGNNIPTIIDSIKRISKKEVR